jgi:hypothetical protein
MAWCRASMHKMGGGSTGGTTAGLVVVVVVVPVHHHHQALFVADVAVKGHMGCWALSHAINEVAVVVAPSPPTRQQSSRVT